MSAIYARLILLLLIGVASGCATTANSIPLSSMSDDQLLWTYYRTDAKVGYYERESLATQSRPSWGIGGAIAQGMSAGISESNADSYRNKKVEILMELRKRGISQFNESQANKRAANQSDSPNAISRDATTIRSEAKQSYAPIAEKPPITSNYKATRQVEVIEMQEPELVHEIK
jgi:hypothetical protein